MRLHVISEKRVVNDGMSSLTKDGKDKFGDIIEKR
jgi:hypothetical protein